MYCRITSRPKRLDAEVDLPASKSISNRVLMIAQLCDKPFTIERLSEAKDTAALEKLLQNESDLLDTGDAGTAYRFLTAYLAMQPGREVVLTGSYRMKERPIAPLVDALNSLGADIQYMEREGFPPLRIKGKRIEGGRVAVDGSVSSQFVSALMLIAPKLPNGLVIHLQKRPVSVSYIKLTQKLMHYFGVHSEWKSTGRIEIPPEPYKPRDITIESDWSSASYWYGLVALQHGASARFNDLHKKSPQGDRIVSSYMTNFGVQSKFRANSITINNVGKYNPYLVKNMINCPDLIPTMTVLCACFNISAHIRGTKTLEHKESDRMKVLRGELGKLGYHLQPGDNEVRGIPAQLPARREVTLDAHNDHRMAMAFSLQAFINDHVSIKGADVVDKSFPNYWETLKNNGIGVKFF